VRRFWIVLALLAFLPAAPVHAEPAENAIEARAHYEAGSKLYDQGRYEEAITEFEGSYRLKPHPNVLYSIAQAHERLLEYGASVQWFERYLREAPPDGEFRTIVENRLRVLRGLPARISITTIPEHVHARVVGTDGRAYQAITPNTFKVPAGTYTVELAQPGWESERHSVVAELGQPYFYQYRLNRTTAPVSIFTRPRGARVFIDDKLVGETPFADNVEVGRHRLLLEHPDYPWHREDVDVKSGAPLKLEVKLTRPVRSGRTELVLASMIYGGVAGPLLVEALSTNSDFTQTSTGLATLLLSSAAGIGAGFLGSFLSTKDGIKVGHSSLIIGGGAWGTAFGAALGLGFKVPDQYVYATSLLGGALGITSTALITRFHDVQPGTAAIMNSGGIWGTAAGAMLAKAIVVDPSAEQLGWFIAGGTSVGVLTGSLLAWKLDVSRQHVLFIDLGGFVGTGLGFAIGYAAGLSTPNEDSVQSACRYGLGGMALGLLAAAVATRGYKGDVPPVEALLFREHGRWAFGLPKINVERAVTPEGSAARLTFTLAEGKW
jgi:hypothetical protein